MFPRLSRAAGDGPAAAPVRIVHLGLGSFCRAHQAWYTALTPDTAQWGIAAFTGRSAALARALSAQDGLYTLITRAADGDSPLVIGSVGHAFPAGDHPAWLRLLAAPEVGIVTLTVTEAGYSSGGDGHLDTERSDIRSDLASLTADPTAALRTVPGRLVAGLAARRVSGAGPLAVVSCDNLPHNGSVTAAVVTGFAQLLDRQLASWITDQVSFVTTMVDRITPASTAQDAVAAATLTGRSDAVPVVTEPFAEWVISGGFPAGRPAWDAVGARFVHDVGPFEQRKLWLLNGAHSLLAYVGSARGHLTIADAVADATCREWMQQWWSEASAHLSLPPGDVADYRDALLTRFANPRIRHLLAQIANDGSQKLPARILPVLRLERARGRLPRGAVVVLAAWVRHLRGAGAPVSDHAARQLTDLAVGPLENAVPAVLAFLAADLTTDGPLVTAVIRAAERLTG